MKFDFEAINRERRRQGVEPLAVRRGPGRPAGFRPQLKDAPADKAAHLYVGHGLSIREVAATLNVSGSTIRRRLAAAGIPTRPNARRSRLRHLNQARLFGSIVDVGVVKTAKRWHIQARTLKRYLAKLRAADMVNKRV